MAVLFAALLALSSCGGADREVGGEGGTGATSSPTSSTTGGTRPTVSLIGDSMSHEARFELPGAAAAAGLDLTLVEEGKAAPCSQLPEVLAQLAAEPDVVVVQWLGNASFTVPCTEAFEPADVVAEYRAALTEIAAARAGTTVVALVGIPPLEVAPWSTTRGPLDDLYREVAAADPGIAYVDTTTALTVAGAFTAVLPCQPADVEAGACGTSGAPAGHAVVRDPIGFHFCPVTYDLDTEDCPVPSSGARRYAQAIVDGLLPLVPPR